MPVLNVFRMFGLMIGDGEATRVKANSSKAADLNEMIRSGVRDDPDVAALAATTPAGQTSVMVWHYHDDDLKGPDAAVTLKLSNLPDGDATIVEYRIDATHSNTYAAWQAMGSPATPTDEQYAQLDAAGALATTGDPQTTIIENGTVTLAFELPRQGVSLFVIRGASE